MQDMNKVYGFEGECKAKYSELTFKLFAEIFNAIPLGQVIGKKILVIHGGLFSKDGVTLDDLRAINRFRQPGQEGFVVHNSGLCASCCGVILRLKWVEAPPREVSESNSVQMSPRPSWTLTLSTFSFVLMKSNSKAMKSCMMEDV